jgi:hypothetical protein
MLKKINLQSELIKEREKSQKQLLNVAKEILQNESLLEQKIIQSLKSKNIITLPQSHSISDQYNLFSIEDIKRICIRYRLRFLDADLFKGEIPYEVTQKIKQLNKTYNSTLSGFKIMAPSRLFKLSDADADPMIFAPTADGKFYLIHKWGTDFAWYKKIISLPTRSFENLLITLIVLSLIITFITPNNLIVPDSPVSDNSMFEYWGFHRIGYFFHFLILALAFTTFIWFSFHKNFSSEEWNKKTFN